MRVEVLTDRPEERFVAGHVLHPEGTDRTLTIVEAAPVDDGPGWRLRFREVDDRAAAEGLRDVYLEALVDRTADLAPGAAYWHEVIGCEVHGLDGRLLGAVADIYRVGEAEVFVVQGGPIGTFDLPVVGAIVRVFAPERGEIVVDEGVLDLGSATMEPRPPRPPRKRPRWSRHGKGGALPGEAAPAAGPDDDSAEGGSSIGESPAAPGATDVTDAADRAPSVGE